MEQIGQRIRDFLYRSTAMKHKVMLESAPIIPVPEGRDKRAMDNLIARQVVIPDIRGNGTREFMTFNDLKRAARTIK